MTQHLVGLLRGEHGGGFVQDEQPRLKEELLEQFKLLLFTGRQFRRACVQVKAEWRGGQKGLQTRALGPPVDHRWHMPTCEQQVFRHTHSRGQREVLVDHANAQAACHDGVGHVALAPVDDDAALLGLLKTRHTFDQRAFASPVFAQQCMDSAWLDPHRHLVHGGETAKAFGQVHGFQRHRACRYGQGTNGMRGVSDRLDRGHRM